MLLYQPSPSEIASALARALANFPHIADVGEARREHAGAGRVDRAAVLLGAVHNWIVWTDTETIWRIPSCTDPAAYWRLESRRCDCPDWRAKTVLVDGMPLCKHSLALRAYRYIILTRLTQHLAEDGIRLQPTGFGRYLAYRDACEFRIWRQFDPATGKSRGPYRFKTDYDLSLSTPPNSTPRPTRSIARPPSAFPPKAFRSASRRGRSNRPPSHPSGSRRKPAASPTQEIDPCHPSKTCGPTAG